MSSDAIESQGTVVAISNENALTTVFASATFVAVGEVKSWSGPGGSASVIDVSHLGSTRKEKRIGLPDEGQIQIGYNRLFDNSGQEELQEARAARQQRWLKFTYSDGNIEYGAVYVMEFSNSGAVDGVVEGSATFEITGAWTEV